jgi:hypothetical protein
MDISGRELKQILRCHKYVSEENFSTFC